MPRPMRSHVTTPPTSNLEDADKTERVHTRPERPPGVDEGAARKNLARAMASALPIDVSLEDVEALG